MSFKQTVLAEVFAAHGDSTEHNDVRYFSQEEFSVAVSAALSRLSSFEARTERNLLEVSGHCRDTCDIKHYPAGGARPYYVYHGYVPADAGSGLPIAEGDSDSLCFFVDADTGLVLNTKPVDVQALIKKSTG